MTCFEVSPRKLSRSKSRFNVRHQSRTLLLCAAIALSPAGCKREVVLQSVNPATYELKAGLELHLIAREPDVVDPVALTFDEDGRMYVVEMRDYPYGIGPGNKPGGTVRLLEDADGNGTYEHSTLFAENLSFPTSIAPWNGGVLVTAPPEIIYLKDTTGDGRSDVREVWFSGFNLGVTDSNVNGLRWGLDGRIHGVNGGNGGNITSRNKGAAPVPIRSFDFSFDPRTGDLTPTFQTGGGFGLVFDEWGRSFVTYNINHIQQRVALARYFQRVPGFPAVDLTVSISDHADMARIFPVSPPETRVNHPEQSGHFSAAGGLGFVGSAKFSSDMYGSVMVCDVAGNIVHRDVLKQEGVLFVARRAESEQSSEFFASRENACRPVGIELGPDGALYLIDMQRDVIEHPDYIPAKVREKLDIRAGEDRGRIYRIGSKTSKPAPAPRLSKAATKKLVKLLGDRNQWTRITAQRLLIERNDPAAIDLLREAMQSKEPFARLHALWTLHVLGGLQENTLLRALVDIEREIRENAVQIAEQHSSWPRVQDALVMLASDRDARVRFHAALAIGGVNTLGAYRALQSILVDDMNDRWLRLAAMSSLTRPEALVAVARAVLLSDPVSKSTNSARLDLARELTDLIGANPGGDFTNVTTAVDWILDERLDPDYRIAMLRGLNSGISRTRTPAGDTTKLAKQLDQLAAAPQLRRHVWELSRSTGLPEPASLTAAISEAATAATNRTLQANERIEAIRTLALGKYGDVASVLLGLLAVSEPAEIQSIAVASLGRFREPGIGAELLKRWTELSPSVRKPVLDLLLQRLDAHPALLDAIEGGAVKLGELNLDLEQRRRLLRRSTPEVKERAAKLIGDEEYSNRKTIVDEWMAKLPATGDAARGRTVFGQACTPCHKLDGVGFEVAPDLGSLAHRSVEDLLSNILDPNMAINPAYISFNVETQSGDLHTGILKGETPDAITLLQAQALTVTIPRADIKQMKSTGLSLMPEGYETTLAPQDLRDLIAYLHVKR